MTAVAGMLTFKDRNKYWWRIFEAAPPELREVMNRAIQIREEMKLLRRPGVASAALLAYQQRLDKAEAVQWALLWHWWTENPDTPGAWRVHGTREERRAAGDADHVEPLPEPEPIDLDDLVGPTQ